MRRRLVATALAVPATAALLAANPAQAQQTVQFQPEPCLITLAPQYTASPFGEMSVVVPPSAVQCPGFTYDYSMDLNVNFVNASGEKGPNLGEKVQTTFDPSTNAVTSTQVLELMGPGQVAGPFTGVAPDYVEGSFWLDSPTDNTKHYRLVLARPFDVVRSSAPVPSCTLTLADKYAYRWNQEHYFVIPDSAVKCTGFTYNSSDYSLYMSFGSRVANAGSISIDSRRVFNPATGTYSRRYELRLTSFLASGQSSLSREHGVATPAGSEGWTWGRFTQGPAGAEVEPNVKPDPNQVLGPVYRLTLARSFAIKRATDVTAKVRRTGNTARVSIHADRNWSFRNGAAQTHRRQTVLSASPADHALLKRNGKTIRRIALSPYGNATITVPAGSPRRAYTVTMVETDDNFAGIARFRA